MNLIQNVSKPPHPRLWMLERYAPHNSMDLISFLQQQFRQITTILASDTSDKCFFHIKNPSVIFEGRRKPI
jgi:hypothetical protein